MLLYKDGRIYLRYLSFILLVGCYINPDPGVIYEYGMGIWLENEKMTLELCEDNRCETGDIRVDMEKFIFEDSGSFEQDTPITEVELGGLKGYEVLYHTTSKDMYEIWFELPGDDVGVIVTECPRAGKGNVKERPGLRDIFDSIRKENIPDLPSNRSINPLHADGEFNEAKPLF